MKLTPALPTRLVRRAALLLIGLVTALNVAAQSARFTPLTPLPLPRITASADAFSPPMAVENILKTPSARANRTEYASRGLGERTFIDFDFGGPVRVAGFRHVQRRTPDLVAEADLVFADTADFRNPVATVKVHHVATTAATTTSTFAPITARYVRWQVTAIKGRSRNVGGRSIDFFSAGDPVAAPTALGITARRVNVIDNKGAGDVQPLRVTLDSPYSETIPAVVRIEGLESRRVELKYGESQPLDYVIPAADSERKLSVAVEVAGATVLSQAITVAPSRHLTVYILAHSHTDIGYTAVQTDIEEKQVNNLLLGLAEARRTATYPAGARFIWNVEVLWAADLFLKRMTPAQQADFLAAVKNGQIALNGMYLNELTGLCRPEELVRLFRYATEIAGRTGVPVDSAMISDVPGYTWGTVTAMQQAGIRYFSVAPNYFDRIGTILQEWENKPFWWVGPDGTSKVLVWIPYSGYAMSMRVRTLTPQFVDEYLGQLDRTNYAYDVAYMRWAGHGDNAVPDGVICDFVRDWNAAHAWPKFVISSTTTAFSDFEKRYGDKLPRVRGDWTPYWEDGAGSSAAETALNRATSDRLVQAETLWALLDRKAYPTADFTAAWNNVLLYSEHTWGAFCSITEPANPFTADQWNIKQTFATTASLQSRQLLSHAAQRGEGFSPGGTDTRVDLFNTTSWPRNELVVIPRELSGDGNIVTDERGQVVPSQRLASRALAVQVRDLPAFSGRRYTISKDGSEAAVSAVKADGAVIQNENLTVRVDPKTGGIVELRARGIDANLVDTSRGHAVNDYLYLIGDDVSALQRNGPVKISVRDKGPLVASLLIESAAPGCHQLQREIRLVAGADYVELLDTVDKERIKATDYKARNGKESVNFAFPFNVPGGEMKLDVPLGVIRPEADQMPSACKNWLTVGRWAEVANRDYGVTWVTLDAPLIQVGGITATLLNSQTDPSVWRKHIEPTQAFYVWAMNNHWGTNYRAYQEGPVQFRFVLRPHRGPANEIENARFATGFSQPVVAVPGRGPAPRATPLLGVDSPDVLVTALKPSDDGKGWIVRLFGAAGRNATTRLTWSSDTPVRLFASDTTENAGRRIDGPISVPAWSVVTVRVEQP